ncbi:hypothetical protein AVEN_170754-1 [Araneus ventricosus]|uniref:Uncharacterized protein n=1 Tax=Araneus ventricosus TaxID=182803 RepID=A0A4Y2NEF8_ARAVE|nr:hypothetical protein AVEN_170754-1 [Araneus ventricosus]
MVLDFRLEKFILVSSISIMKIEQDILHHRTGLWKFKGRKSFNNLKQALITSLVLTYPRTDEKIYSGYGCSKMDIGKKKPASAENWNERVVIARKENYCITQEPEGQIGSGSKTSEYEAKSRRMQRNLTGNADALDPDPVKSCKHCTMMQENARNGNRHFSESLIS